MSLALLFPGQGSQATGMGADVLDDFPALVADADALLGYSIRDLCLNDAVRLRRTEYAQPALYVVSSLAYLKRTGPAPSFLAGHSVGEFAALFAAGSVDFLTGLRLVSERGRLMGQATGGGMMAVLGVPLERILELAARTGIADLEVANHNAPGQVVLAGPAHATRALADALDGQGKCVPLNVSVAAHSRYMADAARRFASVVRTVDFAAPTIPVIANVTAREHRVEDIADSLVRHLTSPVRWWDSLCLMAANGVTSIEEIGPGEVLRKIWHRARPQLPAAGPAPGLGGAAFRDAYQVRHAYLAGSMGHGVSGPAMLRRLAEAGLFGFLGTAGRTRDEIEADLRELVGCQFGIGLPAGVTPPGVVDGVVDLALRHGVRHAEAPGIGGVTAELVRWRFAGGVRHLLVKVARLDLARAFLRPAEAWIVDRLLATGTLSPTEAATARRLPVATDLVADATPAWLGDGPGGSLLPAVLAERDALAAPVRVGAGGGIGSCLALATALRCGAEFVVTGSINQCTPQARTSEAVKDLLCRVDVDDTASAPSGELFELGGRSRVVRKGTLFGARAETLHAIYRTHASLADLSPATRAGLERDCFHQPLEEICPADGFDPRRRMAAVFRRYFDQSIAYALAGASDRALDYQIPCGPAMGLFNRAVAGTGLADWHSRDVDAVAALLIDGATALLSDRGRR